MRSATVICVLQTDEQAKQGRVHDATTVHNKLKYVLQGWSKIDLLITNKKQLLTL